MRIAITGGTGFVGRHLARQLVSEGHEAVLIARGLDGRDTEIRSLPNSSFFPIGTDDEDKLAHAFALCDGVAHCAGINREIGEQTYCRVHIEGTRNVVNAARRAGVKKVALLSFLRARPRCGSPYHESKWAAEEIVRASGLDYTILKAGVIYGKGDHMLDHLSHAFHTFPVFALVGLSEKPVRPTAVEDVVRVLQAALIEGRLSRKTVTVTGPEEMSLGEAVRRVARATGKRPFMFRLPLFAHYFFAWCFERTMTIPLVSLAQVRILSEGIAEPMPPCERLPDDLVPRIPFTEGQIRRGLPEPTRFGLKDCRCFASIPGQTKVGL
ncbi:MAG: NAD(P)H-binding protein [Blastocatellia bacterium]|nr:NAD(P)H-binding protein [Blastocatellia bacterium]